MKMNRIVRSAFWASVAVTGLSAGWAASADFVCGDVNKSGTLTATDALSVLKKAVGQSVQLFCPGVGQPLKTGQTLCYDAAGLMAIPCNGTGQDGELQNGVANSFADNGDGTITDATTGLMWEKLSDDGSIHDKDTGYTWGNAFAVKILALNTTDFAGHDDWRLPNVTELESIRNFGTSNPAAFAHFNTGCGPGCSVTTCSCTPSAYFWTSSYSHFGPSQAWFVDFLVGNTFGDSKSAMWRVRAVRSAG